MPSSNRTQLVSVVESTLGTTPTTPRMRLRRFTGEGLRYVPTFEEPNEIRSDRMTGDETQTGTDTGGTINWELHYPYPDGPLDIDFESAFYNPWAETVSRDNDGTADSVITNVATAGEVVTVTTGVTFRGRHLVRFTGFGVANNNGVFVCTTASATVPAFVSSGVTDEAAPPAAARMKVVGFRGAASDITATASGLGSTTLDFTTIGLIVGQWIKIGGSANSNKFATAALNGYARVTAIAATALTLDHLPSGWTTDAGTGKAISVFFGDTIKNGTTQTGQTFEKGFLSQSAPTYILYKGMVTVQMQLNFEAKRKITGQSTYLGMSGAESTTAQDASPDAALALASYPVFASSANVGQVSEAGSALASPNFVRSLQININNNATPIDAVDSLGPAGITGHECQVTGSMSTYFGSDSLLAKFYAGTASMLSIRATKGTQAIVVTLPRVIYNGDGSPQAGGKNQDVMLNLNWRASKDETYTNAQITADRFEYIE